MPDGLPLWRGVRMPSGAHGREALTTAFQGTIIDRIQPVVYQHKVISSVLRTSRFWAGHVFRQGQPVLARLIQSRPITDSFSGVKWTDQVSMSPQSS